MVRMDIHGCKEVHDFREAIRADLEALGIARAFILDLLYGLSEMIVNPLIHNGDEVITVEARVEPPELALCLRSKGYQNVANGLAFEENMSHPGEFSLWGEHSRGARICASLLPGTRYVHGVGFVEAIIPLPTA